MVLTEHQNMDTSPHQSLLNCLGSVLSLQGGLVDSAQSTLEYVIKSMENCDKTDLRIMFIKVIVNTDPKILDVFLDTGGWKLISEWLKDARDTKMMLAVKELVDLCMLIPMNSRRLAATTCAKTMRKLEKYPDDGIANSAKAVVERWRKIYDAESATAKAEKKSSKSSSKKPTTTAASDKASDKATDKTKSDKTTDKDKDKKTAAKKTTTATTTVGGKKQASTTVNNDEESPKKRKKCDITTDTLSVDSTTAGGLKIKIKKVAAALTGAASASANSKKVTGAVVGGVFSDKPASKAAPKVPAAPTEPPKPPVSTGMSFMAAVNFRTPTAKIKKAKSRMDFLVDNNGTSATSSTSGTTATKPTVTLPKIPTIPKVTLPPVPAISTLPKIPLLSEKTTAPPAILTPAELISDSGPSTASLPTIPADNDPTILKLLPVDGILEPAAPAVPAVLSATSAAASSSSPPAVVLAAPPSEPVKPPVLDGPPKSILLLGKSTQKFRVRFPPDDKLCLVKTFELDREERTNVYRNSLQMQQYDLQSEGNALHEARKVTNLKPWALVELDLTGFTTLTHLYGKDSSEKDIQAERNKHSLEVFYMTNRIPDSPAEPDASENDRPSEPLKIIPVEDPETCVQVEILPPAGRLPNYLPPPPIPPSQTGFQQAVVGAQQSASTPFPNYTPDSMNGSIYCPIPPPPSAGAAPGSTQPQQGPAQDNGFYQPARGLYDPYNPQPPPGPPGGDYNNQYRPTGGSPPRDQYNNGPPPPQYWPEDYQNGGGVNGGAGQQGPRYDNNFGGGGGFHPRGHARFGGPRGGRGGFNGPNGPPGGFAGPGPRLPRDQIICKFYAKFGNCKFREKCNYKHGEPGRPY